MKPLSVLYWFRRRPRERGGDWVALQATLDALRDFDVQSHVSDDPMCDLMPYDLIHLYNLCDPYSATDYVLRAARARKPLIATPIYWSHAQFLDVCENGEVETYPELFPGASTPEKQQAVRLRRQSEAELLHNEQKLVLDAAELVLARSRGEREILVEEFEVPREKIQIIYNGVNPMYERGDAARFEQEFGIRDFVFCAARFEERKNQIGIIRAWRNENVPLVLAGPDGDSPYLAQCRAEATPNVHFIGELTPHQVADADAAARVHVLASWWEEVGLSALEAGLAGCNLVMTQNGPGHEYFGDYSFSCDPADPSSIRDAIRAAVERPRTNELATYIHEHLTWENSARATRAAYDQIMASSTLPTINQEALINISMSMAEELHLGEKTFQELEIWAHEMQARLKQPPSVRAALRGWFDHLRQRQ